MNLAVQPLLRDWCARNAAPARGRDGRLLDQFRIDWFRELNRAGRSPGRRCLRRARVDNVQRMQWLARKSSRARDAHPGIDGHGLDAMPDSTPAADSLSPAWYADAA